MTLRDIIREPVFVPESMPCGDLFKQMTDKHTQMAIVVDEFGGTAGIVTLEDVLESIVGNIQDEYDDEEEEISKIDDTTFTVDGVHPHDISEIMASDGVNIRAGHHCAQPLLAHLGLNATARASFAFYNTDEDVDRFLESLSTLRERMGYGK